MKERLWPAGVAAFAVHSLVISALALNIIPSEAGRSQILKDNFCVEMVFINEEQNDHLSDSMPGESHCAEQSDEASQEPLRKNQVNPQDCVASLVMTTQAPFQKPKRFDSTTAVNREISFKKPLRKSVQKKTQKGNQTLVSLSTPTLTSSGANNSLPLFNPPPVYPREARRKKIQGVVMIRLSLNAAGAVDKATALPPRIDPILEDAALSAIYQWRFKPGVRTLEVPIEFKMMI